MVALETGLSCWPCFLEPWPFDVFFWNPDQTTWCKAGQKLVAFPLQKRDNLAWRLWQLNKGCSHVRLKTCRSLIPHFHSPKDDYTHFHFQFGHIHLSPWNQLQGPQCKAPWRSRSRGSTLESWDHPTIGMEKKGLLKAAKRMWIKAGLNLNSTHFEFTCIVSGTF